MIEKRFYKTTSEIEDYRIYDDEEEDAYFISCDEHTIDCLVELLNELYEEVMDLRGENIRFKLVVGEIIEDMQEYVDDDQLLYINQSYVDWIKENVDTTLYSQKGD